MEDRFKDKFERYKFRGKKDNGEWLVGELSIQSDGYYIFDDTINSYDFYEVDPDTISQSTGFKDSNDKLIFEGDLIKTANNLYVVEYLEGDYVYRKFYEEDGYKSIRFLTRLMEFHVCGNIYDDGEA